MTMLPRLSTALAVAGVALALAAWGSSEPSYCSNVSDLESSGKDLGNVNVSSGGVSALESQLKKVGSSANDLVSSAKSDFPSRGLAGELVALGRAARSHRRGCEQALGRDRDPTAVGR
jgi:hypothetical protein